MRLMIFFIEVLDFFRSIYKFNCTTLYTKCQNAYYRIPRTQRIIWCRKISTKLVHLFSTSIIRTFFSFFSVFLQSISATCILHQHFESRIYRIYLLNSSGKLIISNKLIMLNCVRHVRFRWFYVIRVKLVVQNYNLTLLMSRTKTWPFLWYFLTGLLFSFRQIGKIDQTSSIWWF